MAGLACKFLDQAIHWEHLFDNSNIITLYTRIGLMVAVYNCHVRLRYDTNKFDWDVSQRWDYLWAWVRFYQAYGLLGQGLAAATAKSLETPEVPTQLRVAPPVWMVGRRILRVTRIAGYAVAEASNFHHKHDFVSVLSRRINEVHNRSARVLLKEELNFLGSLSAKLFDAAYTVFTRHSDHMVPLGLSLAP